MEFVNLPKITILHDMRKENFKKGKRIWKACHRLPVLSVLSGLLLLPINTSCSCSTDEWDFRSDEEAINVYASFLREMKGTETSNTKEFCSSLQRWKATTDTVYHFLEKDSVFLRDPETVARFQIIHDSIRSEMSRLSETWRYSYEDVLQIKEQTSTFHDDEELRQAVKEAEPFFIALDSVPVFKEDSKVILAMYRQLLKTAKTNPAENTQQMLKFIYNEDIIFRSFLDHLYDMDGEPLSDITHDTEIVCRNIFIAAREKKIPARDAMVYMSMRTVRRLLQNSAVCVEDINHRKMKSKEQGNAYLWMIIQPFISIDQFAIATLTPQERSNFNYVISQLPKSIQFAKTFDIDQRALSYLLPQQLLKMYILTL